MCGLKGSPLQETTSKAYGFISRLGFRSRPPWRANVGIFQNVEAVGRATSGKSLHWHIPLDRGARCVLQQILHLEIPLWG